MKKLATCFLLLALPVLADQLTPINGFLEDWLNASNQQIKVLQDATDLQDAVNLQQLNASTNGLLSASYTNQLLHVGYTNELGAGAFIGRHDTNGYSTTSWVFSNYYVRVESRSTATYTANTDATINWTTEINDGGSLFDLSTDVYTVPEAGDYAMSAHICITNTTSGYWYVLGSRINGGENNKIHWGVPAALAQLSLVLPTTYIIGATNGMTITGYVRMGTAAKALIESDYGNVMEIWRVR